MSSFILVKKTFVFIFVLFLLSGCNRMPTEIPARATNTTVSATETMTAFPTSTIIPTITPTIIIENYPQIDGQVGVDEWENISTEYPLPHGSMYYLNDDSYLYILIDLVNDTGNDVPAEPPSWGDFFYITFDIEEIGSIDAQKDINFGRYPNSYTMGLQYYLEPDVWTTLNRPRSLFEVGFGPSFNSSTPHRIWEFAFDLNEIHARPGDAINVGIRTYSLTPPFDDHIPSRFTKDFSKLITLNLR